jgi:hypothetical protein
MAGVPAGRQAHGDPPDELAVDPAMELPGPVADLDHPGHVTGRDPDKSLGSVAVSDQWNRPIRHSCTAQLVEDAWESHQRPENFDHPRYRKIGRGHQATLYAAFLMAIYASTGSSILCQGT